MGAAFLMDNEMPKTPSDTHDAKMSALARIHGHIGKLLVSHRENRKASETHNGGKPASDKPVPKGDAPEPEAMPTTAEPEGADEQSDLAAPFVNPLDEMSKPAMRGANAKYHFSAEKHKGPAKK